MGVHQRKGEMVIASKFQDVGVWAANGLARVQENKKWGYINTQGQTVVTIEDVDGHEVLKNARGEIIWPRQ